MNKKYTKENLTEIVSECRSYRQVLNKLGLREAGGNYSNIKTRIKQFEINISHFEGKSWAKGKAWSTTVDLSHRLIENSSYTTGLAISSYRLKNQLFKLGYKNEICESCKNVTWEGEKIPLELHHVNGNKFDNRIENLKILCPNCHALTDNYRAKNIGKIEF